MKPELTLRSMAASDLGAVSSLAVQSAGTPQWPREIYEQILFPNPGDLLRRFAMVGYVGEAFAGFAVVSLLGGDDFAELEMIVVDPSFRGCGIGSLILAAIMKAAKGAGVKTVQLEVRPSNRAAIALYRRQGFQEFGRRPSYYLAPAEDALLLEASLARVTVAGKEFG